MNNQHPDKYAIERNSSTKRKMDELENVWIPCGAMFDKDGNLKITVHSVKTLNSFETLKPTLAYASTVESFSPYKINRKL